MIFPVIMVVMMAMATVSTTLGLEGAPDLHEVGSETAEHILDHMVGPNTKNLVSNFREEMAVAKVPSKAR